ncbi:hypothetical protein GJ744_009138 [Endocarpon pusillum]|uniref:Prion-inhibition and propagation HeLo domain-containing protein n=1 Tax=Endocarpon pusillum TaxID=364733 RepID=A0A8H7AI74_9EURO|nr:hypothetical protein GJ744_009138 [Endocarpon pusillum]
MAEVLGAVGSALTLFQLCMQGFDCFRAMQEQEADLRRLSIKLSIEECRLYTWGETMGLTKTPRPGKKIPLQHCKFPETVVEALSLVLDLLDNSQKKRDKYGCEPIDVPQETLLLPGIEQPKLVQQLKNSFSNFKIQGHSSSARSKLVKKTYWAIRDKRKFEQLIADAKDLIDGLQDITRDIASLAMQEHIIGQRIQSMNDIPALETLAEVCKDDYPSFSDAASFKADGLTSHGTVQQGILEWTYNVESDDEDDSDTMTIEAIESMTVTELKHKLSSVFFRRRQPMEQISEEKEIDGVGSLRNGLGIETSILKDNSPAVTTAEPSPAAVDGELPKISRPIGIRIAHAPVEGMHMISDQNRAHMPKTSQEDLLELEIERHQKILEGMAHASLDRDFINESYATYRIGQELDHHQADFFSMLYSYKADIEGAGRPRNVELSRLYKHKLDQFNYAKGD